MGTGTARGKLSYALKYRGSICVCQAVRANELTGEVDELYGQRLLSDPSVLSEGLFESPRRYGEFPLGRGES